MTIENLIEAVHNQGYSYRKSRKYVHAIISMIKYKLARHEEVTLPFGTFRVVKAPKRRRVWALKTIHTFNKRKYRIKFIANF